MSNSVKKAKRQIIVDIIVVVLIAVVVVAVILILSSGKETIVTEQGEDNETSVIICKNNSNEKSFFHTTYNIKVDNELRFMMKNNKMDKLFATYKGELDDSATAEYVVSLMHADYNELLGKNNIHQNTFSPNFTTKDNTLTIELFGNVTDINSVTSKLFFIDASEFNKVKSLSSANLKKLIENKGFSCYYSE